MRHTPAPWSSEHGTGDHFHIHSPDGLNIASTCDRSLGPHVAAAPDLTTDEANARLIAAAPCMDLMLWALTHGWEVSKVSLYDEEGIEGWRWLSPSGKEFDAIGDWSGRPALDDKARAAMVAARGHG